MSIYKLSRYKSGGLDIRMENASGKEVSKDFKQYSKTQSRIGVSVEMPSGRVNTGLTKAEEKYFEDQLGLETGALSPSSKYWSSYGIFIDQDGKHLDEEIPEQLLALKILRVRKDVAESTRDASTNMNVEYLLANQDTEADAKVEKRDWLIKAMGLFSEMNSEQMREYLTLANINSSSMSDKVVKDRVGVEAEIRSKDFITINSNPNKKDILFIQELISYRVLSKVGSTFSDANKQALAFSMEGMINWIKNPENNQAVIGFKKQLSSIKKEKI